MGGNPGSIIGLQPSVSPILILTAMLLYALSVRDLLRVRPSPLRSLFRFSTRHPLHGKASLRRTRGVYAHYLAYSAIIGTTLNVGGSEIDDEELESAETGSCAESNL